MSEPPDEAEPRCVARRAFPPRRDHRRHCRQVVGIARVTEPEQHRDRDDDEQRRPVREPGDAAVEPEHQKALTVMPTPATTITSALSDGSSERARPSNEKRPSVLRARTAKK